jgi:eukaryotic-like serine/threonine-protein kinase
MTESPTIHEPMWFGALADRPVQTGLLRREDGQLCVVETFALKQARMADVSRAFRVFGALERLVHPNLVRVLSTAIHGESLVVTSTFVEGESLASLFMHAAMRTTRVPVDVGCRFVVDVLAGLSATHGMRDVGGVAIDYAHGEVCPRNVIVGVDGRARIAHPCRPGHDAAHPRGPALPYVAPETLTKGTLSVTADVYSVGALLYHVLDGGPPFDADRERILTAHDTGALPTPQVPAGLDWSAPLAGIAKRAMSTDPTARYASASEMAADVRRAMTKHLPTSEHAAVVLYELCAGSLQRRAARLKG